jgi:FMN phosphatase YigB (HAD superfamily)
VTGKLVARAIVFDFNRTIYDPDSDDLIAGALQVLERLSNDFLLVLYCKLGDGRDEKVMGLGLKKFFKKIIFVPNKTPADLVNIAKEFNLETNRIVVVGDRVKSEIAAAKKAGCKAVWLKRGKFAKENPLEPNEKPDCIIFSLSEVLNKIGKE